MSAERVQALRARLAADPFDDHAWEELVSAAERRKGPEGRAELRASYEDLLKTFPTAVSRQAKGVRHSARRPPPALFAPTLLWSACPPVDSLSFCLHPPPPLQAVYWREYAELEIRGGGDPDRVKAVFSRCLLTCLSVDLWRTYLNFIERLNKARGPEGLPEIRQAYEYTLDRLGQDLHAGALWSDYIAFLQVGGGGGCVWGGWAGAGAGLR